MKKVFMSLIFLGLAHSPLGAQEASENSFSSITDLRSALVVRTRSLITECEQKTYPESKTFNFALSNFIALIANAKNLLESDEYQGFDLEHSRATSHQIENIEFLIMNSKYDLGESPVQNMEQGRFELLGPALNAVQAEAGHFSDTPFSNKELTNVLIDLKQRSSKLNAVASCFKPHLEKYLLEIPMIEGHYNH